MRTKVILFASVAAAGCGFSSSSKPVDGQTADTRVIDTPVSIDAAIDAPPDAAIVDFGPPPFTVHLSALPTAAVTLPGSINTDTSSSCSTTASWASGTQQSACFLVGTTITSAGGMTVATGSKPLVLVATDSITLSKLLDVSATKGTGLGAGGNYTVCGAFSTNPGADANGGGGGAGGTFMTQGGPGGLGNNNTVAAGSAPNATTAPALLRGGCPGQTGGNLNAGVPGNGGGAVYLVAANTITLTSTAIINASGGGGVHGGHVSGGSGGGTGGMIMLYAPTITATTATLYANGGGGSSGGDNNTNGTDGNDPASAMTAAPGGTGGGGNGGGGAILTTGGSGGAGGGGQQGGGGGGGGVGYIRSNVTLTGAVASPAVDVVP